MAAPFLFGPMFIAFDPISKDLFFPTSLKPMDMMFLPADLLAYLAAVMAHPAFTQRV